MGVPVVDDSGLPVVVVTFPPEVTADEYVQLFERYKALCAKYEHIAWLIDFQQFDPVTAPQAVRRAASEVFARYRDVLLQSTVCEARVVQNTASRGILTAFDWLTGKKWPLGNFATREAADRWIAERLELDRM
jgi:hypothetical protein